MVENIVYVVFLGLKFERILEVEDGLVVVLGQVERESQFVIDEGVLGFLLQCALQVVDAVVQLFNLQVQVTPLHVELVVVRVHPNCLVEVLLFRIFSE